MCAPIRLAGVEGAVNLLWADERRSSSRRPSNGWDVEIAGRVDEGRRQDCGQHGLMRVPLHCDR